MVIKLRKWGKGLGIQLTRETLEAAQISEKDPLDIQADKGRITIVPVNNQRGKYDIQDLVKRMPKNYKTVEMDWGKPKGKEVW